MLLIVVDDGTTGRLSMTTKLATTNFSANLGGDTGLNASLTRTGIQYSLAPAVAKTLSAMPGYDPMHNVAHARRTLRALMTIAIQPLLYMGAPKKFMAEQLMEALDNALTDHEANCSKSGLPSGNTYKSLYGKKGG
jgi:hypothetical protein